MTTSTAPDAIKRASTWSVYMLECADGSYYTGVTNDLTRRLAAHRAGTASKYTRGRLPVRLIWVLGGWPTRGPALSFEARVKTMPRSLKRRLPRSDEWAAAATRSRSSKGTRGARS